MISFIIVNLLDGSRAIVDSCLLDPTNLSEYIEDEDVQRFRALGLSYQNNFNVLLSIHYLSSGL